MESELIEIRCDCEQCEGHRIYTLRKTKSAEQVIAELKAWLKSVTCHCDSFCPGSMLSPKDILKKIKELQGE